ncbi:MAG: 1-acyl-sn-glycerol-3-phosphate acyltransferase, partial [Faecousia sp.]
MVTPGREPVIENIRQAVGSGEFNAKVEVGDPTLTPQERNEILNKYRKVRKTPRFRIVNWAAGRAADVLTWILNKDTVIQGLENIQGICKGAIITSNHFNPAENTVIRLLSQKMRKGNLYIVSQDSNLKMKGVFGFFMYYMDIIPVSRDREYMTHHFETIMAEAFRRGQNVLIYPEQEMWFNYRKPRPGKRG